jgi:uncharacterized OB-fold protein
LEEPGRWSPFTSSGGNKIEFRDFALSISQTKVARFAKDLSEGKIMATLCRKCGKRYYPPRADCADCMGSEMEWKPVGSEGKLLTFTKIYIPPEHFGVRQPLMPFSSVQFEPCPIGILEVEDGLRIMGWMPKIDLKKIRVGMKLKALPQILLNGKVTIVFEML